MISSDEDDESDDEEKAREEMQGFIAVSNYCLVLLCISPNCFGRVQNVFRPDQKQLVTIEFHFLNHVHNKCDVSKTVYDFFTMRKTFS